jgi:exodeoxyribonuclease V gamma subunit
LERLEAYEAGTRLLEYLLAGHDYAHAYALIRAGGNLPLGTPGELDFEVLLREVQPLLQEVRSWATTRLSPLDVSLDLGEAQLVGRLSHRYRQGQLWYNFKRLSGKHVVMAWIRHLALCVARPGDQELRSRWLGRMSEQSGALPSVTFRPVPDARAYLADLVALYRIGTKEPLLFFPKSAWSFVKAEEPKALIAARRAWGGETGEGSDPHYQRAFRDGSELEPGFSLFAQPMAGGDFPSLARRVFGPALDHLEGGAAC